MQQTNYNWKYRYQLESQLDNLIRSFYWLNKYLSEIHMKMLTYWILLGLLLMATQSAHYNRHSLDAVTENKRTETLQARCPVPRPQFYNSQYNDSLSVGRQSTGAALKIDGDGLIYNLLSKNNEGVKNEVNKSMGSIVLYVIFMVIGLLAMVVLAPVMVCCCCRPDKCPPCRKCTHPEDHVYSGCERKWPPILIILLALIVIGTMIAVLVVHPDFQKGYSETRCSTAMFFDDLINGNYTRDGTQYFIGLKPLQVKFNSLNDQFQKTISGSSSSQGSNNILKQLLFHSKQQLKQSPNMQLNQVSPNDLSRRSPGPKTMGSSLGSTKSHSWLIGQTRTHLGNVDHLLGSLFDLSSLLGWAMPKLTQSINEGLQKYADMVNTAENLDKSTDDRLQKYQDSYIGPYSIVVYIIACLAIASSIVLIAASLFLCLKQRTGCTKLLYASCTVLTLLGILLFILSIAMSAATAGTHYGCQYIQVGLQTKSEFLYRFQPIFNNQLLTEMVAECATQEGNGLVLNQELIGKILTSVQSGTKHMAELQTLHQHQISPSRHTLSSYHDGYMDMKPHVLHFQDGLGGTSGQTPPKINCQVLGEDAQLITNTFCTHIFNYAFSMRVLTIIAGFALLAIMILSTCYGVRASKSQKPTSDQDGNREEAKGEMVRPAIDNDQNL